MTFISVCFAAMQNALVNVLVNDCIDFVMLKDGRCCRIRCRCCRTAE